MKTWKSIVIALIFPIWLCSCQGQSNQDGPPPPPPIPARPYRITLLKISGQSELEDIPAGSLKQGMKLFQFDEGTYYTLKIVELEGDLASLPSTLDKVTRDGTDLIAITHPTILRAVAALEVRQPIVFGILGDPLALGAGESEARHRPGLTGSYNPLPAHSLLAVMKYYLPQAKRVGVLFNGQEPLSVAHKEALIRDSAQAKLEVLAVDFAGREDLSTATDELLKKNVDAVGLVTGLGSSASEVIEQARQAKVPVFGLSESHAQRGAIAAEVPVLDRVGLEAGRMIYRVLSGEKPAGIPFARIVDTEAIVNTKVASDLAITLPVGALRISRPVGGQSSLTTD